MSSPLEGLERSTIAVWEGCPHRRQSIWARNLVESPQMAHEIKKVIQIPLETTGGTLAALSEPQQKSHKRRRVIRRITSVSPTASSAEIPVLRVLSDAPQNRLRAKAVIRVVGKGGKWFDKLSEDDLVARYLSSKRKIVEIAIRYARKNLVLDGMLFPPRTSPGIWEITPKGLERIRNTENWRPKYSVHEGIIIEEV